MYFSIVFTVPPCNVIQNVAIGVKNLKAVPLLTLINKNYFNNTRKHEY